MVESRNNINPEIILEVKIVQPCHCNVCGSLGTMEVEFGLKYEENNSRTQSFRLCDDCSKKLAELLMNK